MGINNHCEGHNFKTIGKFIIDEKNKLPENDQDVVIEPDVWIGCNVTILKGVIKDVPPYAIVGGNLAKVIRCRFSENEIIRHEQVLDNESFLGNFKLKS